VGGPACAAWFYPGGGWIAPAALVRHWLQDDAVEWRGDSAVARLERRGAAWHLFDVAGAELATADAVVFANAGAATALWAHATDEAGHAPAAGGDWIAPLAATRGQVSIVAAGTPGLRSPALPIAGSGYALTLPDGAVMCGASSTADDVDVAVRLADHAHNLRQLVAVTGSRFEIPPGPEDDQAVAASLVARGQLGGRVGWRATAADRLPLVGAVPLKAEAIAGALPDQPRHWPRVPGLFVASGFGSRGLTWAPLAGRLIAAWIADAPYPVEADVVDALDPARFCARKVRAARRPG